MDNGAGSYRRFLEGDDQGFVELIREYKDGLILYLNGILNNIYMAEELTEETFFKLAVKKPRFSGRSSFKTWLYSVGRNTALDHLRHISRKREDPLVEYTSALRDAQDIEENYIKLETKKQMYSAMQRLKTEHRQILWLIFFEDFSNKEAAQIIGKSRAKTDDLLYRAKRALANELIKEGFVYEEL